MKALPWVLAGVVAVGGAVGAGIYFFKGKGGAQPAPQQPKAAPAAAASGGGPNWGAIAQGVGSALPGVVGALGSIFGG